MLLTGGRLTEVAKEAARRAAVFVWSERAGPSLAGRMSVAFWLVGWGIFCQGMLGLNNFLPTHGLSVLNR